jgi:hypothetical protein
MPRRNEQMDELLTELREGYNPPPPTPREEMWAIIQSRLRAAPGSGVHSMDEARRARAKRLYRPLGWITAAAALLVLGLGIGRMTAPEGGPGPAVASGPAVAPVPNPAVLRTASLDHLVKTETLLTLVRADARAGRVEPSLSSWARGLLSQTRLLIDAQGDSDPAMKRLLEDLELVLVQIVGVTNENENDPARVRSELNLALDGIEERDILPRIQAVIPASPRFVGT